ALVPIGLGLGLLFLAVLLNSDRARYRHPAEPFLVVTYTVGAYALWQAAQWIMSKRTPRHQGEAIPSAPAD
ncbi:MAG: hypothetical protein NTV35_06610, partial [Chloroflexi bacterium]|nr:hypothetical protein [Chloroflexota bacterium]